MIAKEIKHPSRLPIHSLVALVGTILLGLLPGEFRLIVGWPFMLLVLGLIAVVLASRAEDRIWLITAFIGGYALRLLVLGLITPAIYTSSTELLVTDSFRYETGALNAIQAWTRGHPFSINDMVEGVGALNGTFYMFVTAWIYHAFGHLPVLVRETNCFLGAIVVLPLFRLIQEAFDRKVARSVSVLYMLFPSAIFWSIWHLKEAFDIFLLCVLLFFLYRMRRAPRSSLPAIALCGYLLYYERSYLIYVSALSVVAYLSIAPIRRWGWGIGLAGFLFVTGLAAIGFFLVLGGEALIAEALRLSSSFLTLDSSSALAGMGSGGLLHFPINMVHLLLTPLPWKAVGLDKGLIPSMLIWYPMIPLLVGGMYVALRQNFDRALPLVMFVSVLFSIYAIIYHGGHYRGRDQLLPLMLPFVAVAWQAGLHRRREYYLLGAGLAFIGTITAFLLQ